MKNLILVFCFSLQMLAVNLSSQGGLQFHTSSLNSAKSLAAKSQKLVFVDFYTDWCTPCKWMDQNVYTDEKAGKFYNTRFINIKINAEAGKGVEWAGEYDISLYPTLLFLDKDGEVVHKVFGAKDVEEFIKHGLIALQPDRRLSFYRNGLREGRQDPAFLRSYAFLLSDIGDPSAGITAERYLQTQSEWKTQENLKFILKFAPEDLTSELTQHIFKNIQAYYVIAGVDSIDRLLLETLDSPVNDLMNEQEREQYFEYFPDDVAVKYLLEDRLKKILTESPEEIVTDSIATMAHRYVNEFGMPGDILANNLAWRLSEISSKEEDLWLANRLVEYSVSVEPRFHNLDTYAHILFKLGRYTEAKNMARLALDSALQEKINPTSTVLLIEEIEQTIIKTQDKN